MDIDQFKADLRRDEGEKFKPYTDTVGKLTIGVGRNLTDRGISQDESDYLLGNDIKLVISQLDANFLWWRQMTENRQRAFANFVFNVGIGTAKTFTNTLAFLKVGNYDRAAFGFANSLWAKQVKGRADRIIQAIKEG